MQRFKRIVIRGKRGRGVPVLLSTDVQEHLKIIVSRRQEFLKENNPYLFSNLNSSEPIVGYKILKKYAARCGAKNPEGITCTKLRKHLATLSQIFNMMDSDLK
ncbi:hypothetical protein WA026_012569 [Henosepilachna vigintioctopunctata]|uniref:Uncharacterized protein n=1 Tax=Henosepilachna vigintioctopunctata TaxID=420089 RepID=A0AAW1U5R2_9CUCU